MSFFGLFHRAPHAHPRQRRAAVATPGVFIQCEHLRSGGVHTPVLTLNLGVFTLILAFLQYFVFL